MPVPYIITPDQANAAPTMAAATSIWTATTHATRALTFREIQISGLGTASAANEMLFSRVGTLGVTAANAITPGPLNTNDVSAAGFTVASRAASAAWTTEPVISTARTLMRFGVNANGALFRWVAAPGLAIDSPAGAAAAGQTTMLTKQGSSQVIWHAIIEEN
jgi:hypothetical protein